jgi:hypothetical protein
MAQFDFIASDQDRPMLLEALLADSAILAVWDGWYASKEIPIYDSVSPEFLARIKEKRRCFLFHEYFRKSMQVGVVEQKTGPKAGYFSFAVERLPSGVELTFPACFKERGCIYLRSGNLAYPREVYNQEKQKWESPEPVRRQFFGTAKTILQRMLQQATIDGVPHRIAPNAFDLIQSGTATILTGNASLAHSQQRRG